MTMKECDVAVAIITAAEVTTITRVKYSQLYKGTKQLSFMFVISTSFVQLTSKV